MILLICRIVAVLLLISSFVFFMGKADLFEDLKPQFSKELASFQDLKDAHANEVNSTQLQISDLLMERSKISRQLEEVEQKTNDIENENDFLIPKKSQLEEKLKMQTSS